MSRPLPGGMVLPQLHPEARERALRRVELLVQDQGVVGALRALEDAEERSWVLREQYLRDEWHGPARGALNAALLLRVEQCLLVELWADAL